MLHGKKPNKPLKIVRTRSNTQSFQLLISAPGHSGGCFYPHYPTSYPLAFYLAVCQYIDMFCINCFHPSTSVTNSRPHKKRPSVWRRRSCSKCGAVFTSHERPSLADNKPVILSDGREDVFNLGKLTISISKAFHHAQEEAEYSSLALAQTVEDTLSTQVKTVTTEDIEATTHQVLKQYDELAAMQYAAQHQLISSVKKRGRPSLVSRAPRNRQSPSQ